MQNLCWIKSPEKMASQMLVEENVSNEVAQSSPPSEESSGAVSDCAVSESPVEAESEQPS